MYGNGMTLQLATPALTASSRVRFGAAPVDSLTLEEGTSWLIKELQVRKGDLVRRTPIQVMGPNAFLVTLAATNRAFADALSRADLCLPDGMSVVWGARFLGKRVAARVPGGEFMERMCALCAEHDLSVYFLGGLPGAADGAAKALTARYPGLRVVGTDCPPVGFEQDSAANEGVRARISAAHPDLLCVALGAPKQEIWMLDECDTLNIGAALSVGAAFDTQAGLRKRAPAWTHNIGAEWLYRLAMEPRRLWRRYLIGNMHFAAIVASEWRSRRARDGRSAVKQPVATRSGLEGLNPSEGSVGSLVPDLAAAPVHTGREAKPSQHSGAMLS